MLEINKKIDKRIENFAIIWVQILKNPEKSIVNKFLFRPILIFLFPKLLLGHVILNFKFK